MCSSDLREPLERRHELRDLRSSLSAGPIVHHGHLYGVRDGADDVRGDLHGHDDGRGLYGTDRTGVTGAAYSTGAGWWNDADGKAGTLRAEGHPQEANLLAANVRNGSLSSEVTGTLLAHKEGWSVNDLPMVLQEPQAFVKAKRDRKSTRLNSSH